MAGFGLNAHATDWAAQWPQQQGQGAPGSEHDLIPALSSAISTASVGRQDGPVIANSSPLAGPQDGPVLAGPQGGSVGLNGAIGFQNPNQKGGNGKGADRLRTHCVAVRESVVGSDLSWICNRVVMGL